MSDLGPQATPVTPLRPQESVRDPTVGKHHTKKGPHHRETKKRRLTPQDSLSIRVDAPSVERAKESTVTGMEMETPLPPAPELNIMARNLHLRISLMRRMGVKLRQLMKRVPQGDQEDERTQSLTEALILLGGWEEELTRADLTLNQIRLGNLEENPELQAALIQDVIQATITDEVHNELEEVVKDVEETLPPEEVRARVGETSVGRGETNRPSGNTNQGGARLVSIPSTPAERFALIMAGTVSTPSMASTPTISTGSMVRLQLPTRPARDVSTPPPTNDQGVGTPASPAALINDKVTKAQQQKGRYQEGREGYVRERRTTKVGEAPLSDDEWEDSLTSSIWCQSKEFFLRKVNKDDAVQTLTKEWEVQRNAKLARMKQYMVDKCGPIADSPKIHKYISLDPVLSEEVVGGGGKSDKTTAYEITKWSGTRSEEVINYLNSVERMRRGVNWSFRLAIARVCGLADCVNPSRARTVIEGWAGAREMGFRPAEETSDSHITFWAFEYETMRLALLNHFYQPVDEHKRRMDFNNFTITVPVTKESVDMDKFKLTMLWSGLAELQSSFSALDVLKIAKRTFNSLVPIDRAEQYRNNMNMYYNQRYFGRFEEFTPRAAIDVWGLAMDNLLENTVAGQTMQLAPTPTPMQAAANQLAAAGWVAPAATAPPPAIAIPTVDQLLAAGWVPPVAVGQTGQGGKGWNAPPRSHYQPSQPSHQFGGSSPTAKPKYTKYVPRIQRGDNWQWNLERGSIYFAESGQCTFCGLQGHLEGKCPFKSPTTGEFDIKGVLNYCSAGDFHESWQRRMRKYCNQLRGLSQPEWNGILHTCMELIEAREGCPTPGKWYEA